jgi:hypothetical protein
MFTSHSLVFPRYESRTDSGLVVVFRLACGVEAAKAASDGLVYERFGALLLPCRSIEDEGRPHSISGHDEIRFVHGI